MLEQSQQNVKQQLKDFDSLRSQIKHLEKQLVTVNAEKKSLNQSIADHKFNLVGLEATRDQLESDRYNLQIILEKTDKEYCQVRVTVIIFYFFTCCSN